MKNNDGTGWRNVHIGNVTIPKELFNFKSKLIILGDIPSNGLYESNLLCFCLWKICSFAKHSSCCGQIHPAAIIRFQFLDNQCYAHCIFVSIAEYPFGGEGQRHEFLLLFSPDTRMLKCVVNAGSSNVAVNYDLPLTEGGYRNRMRRTSGERQTVISLLFQDQLEDLTKMVALAAGTQVFLL